MSTTGAFSAYKKDAKMVQVTEKNEIKTFGNRSSLKLVWKHFQPFQVWRLKSKVHEPNSKIEIWFFEWRLARLMLNNLEANHIATLSTKMNIENLAMNRLKPSPKVAIGRDESGSEFKFELCTEIETLVD